jgi:hypothetical protein
MKVFLSHSTKDKQFVQTLAAELEAEKIEPWLCEVDIELGDNFVARIEEGLCDADLTVLFWSPEAARSAWTRLEWTSVTAREISFYLLGFDRDESQEPPFCVFHVKRLRHLAVG